MTDYVAGFMFNPDNSQVVLVRKNRPIWQAGMLNGVGGKINPRENPKLAMTREFYEETGFTQLSWNHFATILGTWGTVWFFRSIGDVGLVKTMEDEEIEVISLKEIDYSQCIPNLSWLIPLALYRHDSYIPLEAIELT